MRESHPRGFTAPERGGTPELIDALRPSREEPVAPKDRESGKSRARPGRRRESPREEPDPTSDPMETHPPDRSGAPESDWEWEGGRPL